MKIQTRIRTKVVLTTVVLCFLAGNAILAQDPIPQKSGVSGFFRPGLGVMAIRSNMVAGNRMLSFGNPRISSLYEAPEGDTSPLPLLNFELRYTFASTRTQVFVGSVLEDLIRFVLTTQIGIKQELPGSSIISLSYLFSAVPTKVWADPYVVDLDRTESLRRSPGFRFNWNRVLGSYLQFRYTYRNIDVVDEESGNFLGLPEDQAALLYRSGKQHSGEVLYRFNLGQFHWIVPALRYDRFDLTGKAMSNHIYTLQLTYTYFNDPVRFIANGFYSNVPFDEENPIYLKTREENRYGLTISLNYRKPFGWRPFGSETFNLYGTLAWFRGVANIVFYDFSAFVISAGVMFRF